MANRRTIDWSKKRLTGEHHWSECQDWKLHKYGTIWDIPISVLEQSGWYQVEMGVEVTIPIQQLVIDYNYSKKGGFDYSTYQLMAIDWEYLLERQARLYASLHWGNEEIKEFHRTQETWLEERAKFLKEKELERTAETLAEELGYSKDQVLEMLRLKEKTETPEGLPKFEEYLEGRLEKLSNEFFIFIEESNSRYKVRNKDLLTKEEPKGAKAENLIGSIYRFQPNTDNPPKSRQAKGWVDSLVKVGQ